MEAACDRLNDSTDADIDNQRVGGMVTLTQTTAARSSSTYKTLHEVWLAARDGGLHYRHDGQCWRDTRTQGGVFADLSRLASAQAGMELIFG